MYNISLHTVSSPTIASNLSTCTKKSQARSTGFLKFPRKVVNIYVSIHATSCADSTTCLDRVSITRLCYAVTLPRQTSISSPTLARHMLTLGRVTTRRGDLRGVACPDSMVAWLHIGEGLAVYVWCLVGSEQFVAEMLCALCFVLWVCVRGNGCAAGGVGAGREGMLGCVCATWTGRPSGYVVVDWSLVMVLKGVVVL